MYLKKLELSGFKSFAKATILEFPSKITAIVGPNGSGKSNIKEAIQWVLGEQSMKSLRGKKGEDLIWNGSSVSSSGAPQVPRMGKASVSLIFDNKDGKIPQTGTSTGREVLASILDFEEVIVGRKIFRDGLNEYYINESQVRLKDVVELAARIGLGQSKHNIIGQGEVDRILLASSQERREMLEEALGLRVYQLKKNEAERKLEATENNMRQVEVLAREIAPHLKFLRLQAQKAENRENLEEELKSLQKIYLVKEKEIIKQEQGVLQEKISPLRKKSEEIKKGILELAKDVSLKEKQFLGESSEESKEEKELAQFESRRRELGREIGRLEGRLEVEKEKASQPKLRVVDTRYVQEEIRGFLEEIRSILEEEDRAEDIKSHLYVLVEDLESLLNKMARGTAEEEKGDADLVVVKELEKTLHKLQEELGRLNKEVEKLQGARQKEKEQYREMQIRIRELDNQLKVEQDEEHDLALHLERLKFEEERLRIREGVWGMELKDAGFAEEDLKKISPNGYENISSEDLKRKIERTKVRLEEIGGIDPAVVTEYQETEKRHSFLTKELEDLKKASVSLKELAKELDQHIKKDFKEGFAKIKEEFNNYFRIIFGGGNAKLQIIRPVRNIISDGASKLQKVIDEEGTETSEEGEEGIEINVDLPRKRIKGLAMLSGGERALASIALLFAISAVNPPPFLILDETDAALDEANSQRYSAILKELSKKTQLILVTHNRETMKCAGILYGVTIGDDGVSKLLSLKLEEAEVYTNK